jgi:hypothetical protein
MGRTKGAVGQRGNQSTKADSRVSNRKDREAAVLKMTMILLEAVDGVHPYDVRAALGGTYRIGLIAEDLSRLATEGKLRRTPPQGNYALPLKALKPKVEVVTEESFIRPPSLARLMGCK